MEIGYGSVSVYDSLRHTLYFDNINKAYFFDCAKKILVILFVYPDEAIRIWDEGKEPIIKVIDNYIKK